MDHYQVEYPFIGSPGIPAGKRFGVASMDKPKIKGNIVVDDAVLPFRVEVAEKSIKDIPFAKDFPVYDWNTGLIIKGGSPFDLFVNASFKAAQETSDVAGVGVQVGKMFTIGVGDGNAYYVVTKIERGKVTVEWRGFSADRYMDLRLGYVNVMSMKDARRIIGIVDSQKDFWHSIANKDDALLASLAVGSMVHHYSQGSDFTRYEVVMVKGKKAYKPLALVGEWQHGRPSRYCNGELQIPHEAQNVLDGKSRDHLQASCVWESPEFDKGWPGRKRGDYIIQDPTNKPAIDLSVPDMTATEAEAARLWKFYDMVGQCLNSQNLPKDADYKDPATVRLLLAAAYKLLNKELKVK